MVSKVRNTISESVPCQTAFFSICVILVTHRNDTGRSYGIAIGIDGTGAPRVARVPIAAHGRGGIAVLLFAVGSAPPGNCFPRSRLQPRGPAPCGFLACTCVRQLS